MTESKAVDISVIVNTQFKLRVEVALVKSLEDAARNHGRRTAQEVAEDILRTYLPFWEQAEQVKKNRIEEQRDALFGPNGSVWAEKAPPMKTKTSKPQKTKRPR